MREATSLGLDTLVEAHDAAGARARDRPRRAGDRDQRARPLDLRDRPSCAARPARAGAPGPDRDRRVRNRDPRAGRRGGARRREGDARRLDADACARPGREARGADLAAARQGLRADAPGGRRRRGRGWRGPRGLHPRRGEPARADERARRARRRCFASPCSSARAGETDADLVQVHEREERCAGPRRGAAPRRRAGRARCSTCRGSRTTPGTSPAPRGDRAGRARGPAGAGERRRGDRRRAAVGGRRRLRAGARARNQGSRQGARDTWRQRRSDDDTHRGPTAPTAGATCPKR